MSIFRRRHPSQLDRVLAEHELSEAVGRVQPEPPRIHNPAGGTRYHFRDPSFPAAHPVCNASGAGWAEGDGGLKRCGLCPAIWAQRQAGGGERAAS
jgi:hypothetical protein